MTQTRFEQALRPDVTDELTAALRERILVIDGAMGTAIQRDRPDEAGYRGERFADHPSDLVGNNDLLSITQPQRDMYVVTPLLPDGLDAESVSAAIRQRVDKLLAL